MDFVFAFQVKSSLMIYDAKESHLYWHKLGRRKTGMGSNSIFGGSYIHQKGVEVVQVQKAFNNKQCKKKTGLIAMFCIHSQKANRLDCRSKIRYC